MQSDLLAQQTASIDYISANKSQYRQSETRAMLDCINTSTCCRLANERSERWSPFQLKLTYTVQEQFLG
jgi:hypothetical protein